MLNSGAFLTQVYLFYLFIFCKTGGQTFVAYKRTQFEKLTTEIKYIPFFFFVKFWCTYLLVVIFNWSLLNFLLPLAEMSMVRRVKYKLFAIFFELISVTVELFLLIWTEQCTTYQLNRVLDYKNFSVIRKIGLKLCQLVHQQHNEIIPYNFKGAFLFLQNMLIVNWYSNQLIVCFIFLWTVGVTSWKHPTDCMIVRFFK